MTSYSGHQKIIIKKTEVIRRSDSTYLNAGFYKTVNRDRSMLFQVNDSGYLIGTIKNYDRQVLFSETILQDGIQRCEFMFLGGRLSMESFDSTVNVFLYDSLKKQWRSEKKKMHVEKEYPNFRNEMRIRIAKGGYDSYAVYYYRSGKLTREIVPHLFEKKYDTSGNIISIVSYNWKDKQIETSDFEKGRLISKMVLKNKNIIWNSKGFIRYPDHENAGNEIIHLSYYNSGVIKKKEITKDGKRVEINYDLKGKIVSQNEYKVLEQGTDSNIVPPAEIK